MITWEMEGGAASNSSREERPSGDCGDLAAVLDIVVTLVNPGGRGGVLGEVRVWMSAAEEFSTTEVGAEILTSLK